VLTYNSAEEVCLWDIIYCKVIKTFNISFDEALQNENSIEWMPNWCQIDTKTGEINFIIGVIVVHMEEGKLQDAEVYYDEIFTIDLSPQSEDHRSII
jgi:hypothetical protein